MTQLGIHAIRRRFHSGISAALTLVSMASPSVALAQAITWPSPRIRHHMFWHPQLRQIVLVGHARDTLMLGWNGTAWQELGNGVDQRANYAMAYDSKRDRLVVHGGMKLADGGMTSLADTWEWDGRVWRQAPFAGPGTRDHHAMTYDPVRRQIVLFGGFRGLDSTPNDTWGWDGRGWKQLATVGPPGRGTHRLVFDTKRGVIVLFGGYGRNNVPLDDTWEWDGRRWERVPTATAPSPRGDTRMAYDPVRERIVLFGGQSGNTNMADTWEYGGRAWSRIDAAGPTMRNGHEMVYDPRTRATLLFGGRADLLLGGDLGPTRHDDLWAFNGRWKQIPRP